MMVGGWVHSLSSELLVLKPDSDCVYTAARPARTPWSMLLPLLGLQLAENMVGLLNLLIT